jgi:hypothetical protein
MCTESLTVCSIVGAEVTAKEKGRECFVHVELTETMISNASGSLEGANAPFGTYAMPVSRIRTLQHVRLHLSPDTQSLLPVSTAQMFPRYSSPPGPRLGGRNKSMVLRG